MGGGLVLHGHGLRARDQWGPPDATAPSIVGEVVGRRYRCLDCRAVIEVLPRGVLRRRLYSAVAVALALALWAVEQHPAAEVRRRVSPWSRVGPAVRGWMSLRRWAKAVRAGELFPAVRAALAGASLREVAARAATTLAAFALSSADTLSLTTRAVLGAAHVAR